MTDHAGHEWLGATAAAKRLGIARRTLYNWYIRGWLQTKLFPSGRRLYCVSGLLKPDQRNPRYIVATEEKTL